MADQLVQAGVGSYDWAGARAPAGGSHTGECTITMLDGQSFVVAHSPAEVNRKVMLGAQASNPGGWVAFDVPSSAVPIVLNATQVATAR